jgi:hypothetical protein
MSSFTKLLSRLTSLNEAKDSPMDRIMPGFQSQARSLAKSKGASSGTREGRLAMLGILFDLDIIDDAVVRMFKNDPSVSRMVEYFEANGIASKIKSKRDDIQAHIKDQLENKVSFTTGNRTDAAQQRYEVNKLNSELKAAKKVARLERKKETASAMSSMSQTVNMYDDLIGSLESSYSSEYMLEIVADRDSDLSDITQIVKYLSKFVDESDIEVEGRSIDIVFGASSKLGKIISKLGIEKIERQIADDLKPYGGAGVVIHEPDINNNKDIISNLKSASSIEDEESYDEEMEEPQASAGDFEGLAEDYSNTSLNPNILKVQDEVLVALGDKATVTEKFDMESLKRTGRGLAGATALVSTVVGGSHLAPKAYQTGKEIVGDIASSGGTDEFLARIKNDEDRERVQNELQALRDEGTAARLSGKSDRVTRMRDKFRKTEQEMRQTYKIPDTIKIQENVNITTAIYLTEQTKSDSVRRVQLQQNLSFKDKYKPKTSFQLEELRRYGL